MEITKFSEKDMETAIGMAQHAWHGYYDEFRAAYIRCIAECIVRHNYTDEDLAFKITDNGEVKGIIFGTRKGKITDLSAWVSEQSKTMNQQEKELLERLNDYMDEADRNTIAQMGDSDVKLSLFISIQKGCGKELLRTIMQEFRAMNAVDRHFVRPRLLPRPRLYLGFPIPRHALLYQRDRLYDLHLLETS